MKVSLCADPEMVKFLSMLETTPAKIQGPTPTSAKHALLC